MFKLIKSFLIIINLFLIIFITKFSYANNLSITNVSLGDRNPSENTVVVSFDLSWENSWRTKINHDAIWVTIRLFDPTATPANKKLCQLKTSGLNPQGMSSGTNSNMEISVPLDKKGVFLRPAAYNQYNEISSQNVNLLVDYSSCGFENTNNVYASVFGIEMVYIPEGSFYCGDYTSEASLNQGSSDNDPWFISSETSIAVSNPVSDGYRYASAGNTDENATGSSFNIPAEFPKGYQAFYSMKYEITEGQWVEFFNSLPSQEARANRDLTNASHKNTDTVSYRNTISCSGNPLACSTSRPARALSYLSWMDLAAFLDWAALRPMTELEFEKISRGPVLPVKNEFAWGSTNITAAISLSLGDENGEEIITNSNANANFNDTSFTGGDTANGPDYAKGPLRSGIFAITLSSRENSGAGYYGVLDLSGNLKERVVTIGNEYGRTFTGINGDGILSVAQGYEGNANQGNWPGTDDIAERGVAGANGSGFKGGSFSDINSAILKISDRSEAANSSTSASNNFGGRGVRSYYEN